MDTRNFTYMFYGFAAIWLILAAYLVSLSVRDRRLRKAMDGLKRLVEDGDRR